VRKVGRIVLGKWNAGMDEIVLQLTSYSVR